MVHVLCLFLGYYFDPVKLHRLLIAKARIGLLFQKTVGVKGSWGYRLVN